MICLVYITCKLIHLGSKVKSRTNRYDLPRKIRTLELLCKTDLQWWNLLTSDLGCPSPQCGKPLKLFYPFLLHLGYLTSKASSNFLLVGSQIFHVRQQDPGSVKTFDGWLGKALMSGKLYLLGSVISSSDAMIVPPGPWNLLLWPGLLIRTSVFFLPHLTLFCVHSSCLVDSHSLDFFAHTCQNLVHFNMYLCWES